MRRIVQRGEDEDCKEDGDEGEAVTGSDREEPDLLLHSARFIKSELELLRAKFDWLPLVPFILGLFPLLNLYVTGSE